jgi:SOS-response transcriptional repressor LexA
MEGMSKRQQEVYDFIEQYHSKNGISPSMADIANGLGLANSTIATYIEALRKKKRVTSMVGVPRSLRVISA